MHTKLLFLLTTTLLLAAPVAPAQVVTSNADAGAGSLRAVVAAASPGATITFATGLSGQTIADPVLAPLGTAARPRAPQQRVTSTSTVGLPRESITSRPRTFLMSVDDIRKNRRVRR